MIKSYFHDKTKKKKKIAHKFQEEKKKTDLKNDLNACVWNKKAVNECCEKKRDLKERVVSSFFFFFVD